MKTPSRPDPHRRALLGAACAALAAGARRAVAQDAYPGKGPIKVIVPASAGGAADASMRLLAGAMQAQMKQSFIVDNKPGGSYAIGMQAIAQAAADGYTLIQLNSSMVSAQAALRKIDLLRSLMPVSLMGTMPAVLVVPAGSPLRTMKELVAWSRANPGKLNYGSVGIGSLEHLWVSGFARGQGIEVVHIPFKGMPEASTALVTDEVQFVPMVYAVAQPLILKGLLRPLALLDQQRHPGMPEVPTLKETGLDAPPMVYWAGIAAPAGTPAPIVEQLRREMAAATADAGYREKTLAMGSTPMVSEHPQAFARLIEDELRWMNAAVKAARLQLD